MKDDVEVHALDVAFAGRGYTFRHHPDATCAVLRWQAGRAATQVYRVRHPNSHQDVEIEEEIFTLVATSATRAGLTEKLGRLEAQP